MNDVKIMEMHPMGNVVVEGENPMGNELKLMLYNEKDV